MRRLSRQRQGKVAQTAEKISHALVRLHIEQTHRTPDQHTVDVKIDLREIRRTIRHTHAEFRQIVVQRLALRIKRVHRIRPFGLQPHIHAVRVGKLAQDVLVLLRQFFQIAKDQHGVFLPHRHLDLRHTFTNRQFANYFTQNRQQIRHMLRQNLARSHIGHVARLFFKKADQYRFLFRHVARGQTRPIAVVPRRPHDRAQDDFRFDLADAFEVILQHALLDRHLRTRMHVLHGATATHTEIHTFGLYTRSGGLEHLSHLRHIIIGLAAGDFGTHRFIRQSAGNKRDFLFMSRNTAPFHVQGLNFVFKNFSLGGLD